MKDMGKYNAWANERIVNWLRNEPAQAMAKEVPSSFPSIRLTLAHIRGAETYWLSVFTGAPSPDHYDDSSMEALFDSVVRQSVRVSAFVNGLDESAILRLVRKDESGATELPLYQFLIHVFNHSTFHRGQIVTIARNVGLTRPPVTDFEYFALHAGSEWV